jgi:glycerol kinase
MSYLLALDQGTSSSRSIVFDAEGRVVAMAQREFRQIYPQPGWVEHDPEELWQTQLATAREAVARAGITATQLKAVGITNQRETTVVWNRRTGAPVYNAIVWQDRRAEPLCARLREQGHAERVRQTTGLIIDAYFSATKIHWILDQVPGARDQAQRGELAFGTVDSWLLWKLTGGRVHATDVSNASRTLLFDIRRNAWDPGLLEQLDLPSSLLPAVHPSSHVFGETDAALLQAMNRDAAAAGGVPVSELRVDGGACVNDLLMQFQCDLLGIPVVRPRVIETTALGAAYLAGLSCGLWKSTDELAGQWQAERRFLPTMERAEALERMARWERAVRQTVAD